MSDIILTIIVLIIVSGFLRRIIFSSAYNAFQRAADDFSKKNQHQNHNASKKQKTFWSNTQVTKHRNKDDGDGEFVDYEEIK